MRASFVLFLDGLSGGGDFAFIKACQGVKSGRNVVLLSTRHSPSTMRSVQEEHARFEAGNIRSHVKTCTWFRGTGRRTHWSGGNRSSFCSEQVLSLRAL